MSRTPNPKSVGSRASSGRWAAGLGGLSALILLSFAAEGPAGAWMFAAAVALFPLCLFGLSRGSIGRAWGWMAAVLILPTLALLAVGQGIIGGIEPGNYRLSAWLLAVGFWLVPFVATSLWHGLTWRASESPGADARPPRRQDADRVPR